MRSPEVGRQEDCQRSRGGWALLWRLYLWSTRNCRLDDLPGDAVVLRAEDHPRGPADALA